MDKIKGHIVKILDESSVVINLGLNKGIEPGYDVEIVTQIFDNVIDPITNENLGSLYTTKNILFVSRVFDKMSICTGQIVRSEDNLISQISNSQSSKYKRQLLNIDYNDLDSHNSLQEEPIKIGDIVFVYLKSPKTNT